MGSTRRSTALLAVGAIVVGTLGTAVALADQDADVVGSTDPSTLLETLDGLEDQLPRDVDTLDPLLDAETTWGTFSGDAGSVSGVLSTLAPELRALFVEADDVGGEVGDAVAAVARGWLDVWHATESLTTYELHDLAFPVDTFDDDGVATGADELRGTAETGLALLLQGRARHLDGYGSLRQAGQAEPAAQAKLDARAAAAEVFDQEVRPVLLKILSQQTASLLVPVERFETDGPGVDPRANSVTYVCVDRQAVYALGEGELAQLTATEIQALYPPRADCPELAQDDALLEPELDEPTDD